jgi:hypothetical protein
LPKICKVRNRTIKCDKPTNMDNQAINTEKITTRLKTFNYDFEVKGTVIKIYLPMLCYLKINWGSGKIKITSHISFGFRFLSIEINFIIYGLILYVLTWFQWTNLNKGIFALFGILLIYFVICFIKLESMRSITHNWIEKDS